MLYIFTSLCNQPLEHFHLTKLKLDFLPLSFGSFFLVSVSAVLTAIDALCEWNGII